MKGAGFHLRVMALALALGLLPAGVFVPGCAKKEGLVEPAPQPPLPAGVTVDGNVVRWRTDVASRGSVRYGFAADNLDHMAYPAAAGRRDREMRLEHAVPLLDLRPGVRVYIQTVNEATGRPVGYSEVGAFDPAGGPAPDQLTSTMIHIGFGDSHLVTMPNGKRVLIDGGERAAAQAVEEFLDQHGVTAIDAAFATHVHIDHMGGLVGGFGTITDGVLARFAPRVFFDSPEKSWDRDAHAEALQTVANSGVPTVILQRGDSSADTPELAWDARVRVVVLSSGKLPGYVPEAVRENTDINNDSIVLEFSYGDVDFIIGGDAEAAAEASILQAVQSGQLQIGLEVEYYKVHHHGLPDATTAGWVAALLPRVAFIPNTQQTWDGSLAEAIGASTRRLTAAGADVYVVDESPSLGRLRGDGRQYNITFATDGHSYEVRLEQARQATPGKSSETAGCILHDPDLQELLAAP